MYGVQGDSWIALGDPVGEAAAAIEVAWRFREHAHRAGARPAFYQVSAEQLPLLIDLGMSVHKIGESASVPLDTFSLEGGMRKGLRRSHRDIARQGVTFEVVLHPADGVLPPPLTVSVVRALGLVSLAVVSSYVVANVSREAPVRLLGWELPMPGWRLALMQLAVAIADWTLATMVLYVLLPDGHGMGVLAFSALFLLAQVAGLLSHVPGGVGVFDTLMVLLMKSAVPVEQMMATLLLYRLVYYLMPCVVGAALLVAYEARARVVGAANGSPRGIASR